MAASNHIGRLHVADLCGLRITKTNKAFQENLCATCCGPRNTTTRVNTHIGHNLDLLVLRLVEDVCVLQSLQQGGPRLQLLLQEANKLVQLLTTVLKVVGKLVPSRFV